MNIDYYQILNISKNATIDEIKKAYRKQSLLFHPDINKQSDAHSRFIEINQAYTILIDSEKRKIYDELEFNFTVNKNSNSDFAKWQYQGAKQADRFSQMPFENFKKALKDNIEATTNIVKFTWRVFIYIWFAGAALWLIPKVIYEIANGSHEFEWQLLFTMPLLAILGLGGIIGLKKEFYDKQ